MITLLSGTKKKKTVFQSAKTELFHHNGAYQRLIKQHKLVYIQ